MRTESKTPPSTAGSLATCSLLAGALFTIAASAAEPTAVDPAVAELTQPHSIVEVGVGDVSDDSFKFGEYNGLQRTGLYGVGSIDLRGGGAYDSSDATRWRVTGTDLGLSSRSAYAEYGQQGRFRVSVAFDSLRRNRSDSYYSPYLGVGSSVLTLPAGWQIPLVPRVSATAANARGLLGSVATSGALVSGVLTAPTAAQLAVSNALIAADVPLFAQHELYTTRHRFDLGASVVVTPNWDFSILARRENRDGTKPMGSVTRFTGSDISTVLADPIDTTTDQVTATLGYRSKHDFLQLSYYGSKFDNKIASLTWSNWTASTANATMSSTPSNEMHQFSLTAGHNFNAKTRLVANASYSRNTQNDTFLTDASTPLVPVTSLNGKVVSKYLTVKLSSRPFSALNLTLDYKFDERKNDTPVHIFGFYDANQAAGTGNVNAAFAAALGVPAALLTSSINVNANRPYSRRLNEFSGTADFRLTPTQALRFSYEHQKLDRWCEGTWISCIDAADTTDDTLRAEWRAEVRANLNTHLSYTYNKRKVDFYDENAFLALVPMANVSMTTATGGATAYSYMVQNGLTGYGPLAGLVATAGNANLFFPLNNALANATYANQNRISELYGMRRFNMADRDREKIRAAIDWQPAERLALQANADYRRDNYDPSRYGLLDARDWAANLEGTFSASENLVFTAFFTHEDQRARSAGNTYTANSAAASVGGFTAVAGGCFATIALRNASNKIDPCLDWSTDMRDKTDVYGLAVDRKGLFTSKLNVGLDLTFTRARSTNDVSGGNYANNPLAVAGAPAGSVAAFFIAATALPTVSTDTSEVRLKASYALSQASTLHFVYLYADMSSSDYAYEGMQFGGLTGVLPSLEQSPHYTVQVVEVSYSHRF